MQSWLKHIASILLMTLAFTAQAETPVPPVGQRVTDLTQTLTPSEVEALAHELERIDTDTGARVLVLIVDSLQEESIEQYATRVFDSWKPGRKGVDDGVIILLAKKERKMRIEVGRGLEGAITDLTSKRITSEKMVPSFKANHFAMGFTDAAHEIERLVRAEKLPAPGKLQPAKFGFAEGGALLLLLTLCGLGIGVRVVAHNRRAKAERDEQAERARRARQLWAQDKLTPVPVHSPDVSSERTPSMASGQRSSSSRNTAAKAAVVAAASSRSRSSSWSDDSSSRTSSSYDSSSSSSGSSNSYSSDSSSGSSAGGGASDSY